MQNIFNNPRAKLVTTHALERKRVVAPAITISNIYFIYKNFIFFFSRNIVKSLYIYIYLRFEIINSKYENYHKLGFFIFRAIAQQQALPQCQPFSDKYILDGLYSATRIQKLKISHNSNIFQHNIQVGFMDKNGKELKSEVQRTRATKY